MWIHNESAVAATGAGLRLIQHAQRFVSHQSLAVVHATIPVEPHQDTRIVQRGVNTAACCGKSLVLTLGDFKAE